MKKLLMIMWLFSAALFLAGCNSDDNNGPKSYPFQVRMTDAPGDYDAVMIDVQRVEVHSSSTGNSGWTTLSTNARMYDLTKLTNGKDTLLANANLPFGTVSQIRLILGNNNSVTIDGKTYPLETPSAQQSGLKLNVHETLTEGITYSVTLDFDASRSIVEKGNGKYSLKPVIRTFTTATSGAIKGSVSPDTTFAKIYAIMGTDSFGTMTNSTGNFLIPGLKAGSYNVVLVVPSMNNKQVTKSASVTIGQVTDLGTIAL